MTPNTETSARKIALGKVCLHCRGALSSYKDFCKKLRGKAARRDNRLPAGTTTASTQQAPGKPSNLTPTSVAGPSGPGTGNSGPPHKLNHRAGTPPAAPPNTARRSSIGAKPRQSTDSSARPTSKGSTVLSPQSKANAPSHQKIASTQAQPSKGDPGQKARATTLGGGSSNAADGSSSHYVDDAAWEKARAQALKSYHTRNTMSPPGPGESSRFMSLMDKCRYEVDMEEFGKELVRVFDEAGIDPGMLRLPKDPSTNRPGTAGLKKSLAESSRR